MTQQCTSSQMLRGLSYLLALGLWLCSPTTWAVYSCTVTATSVGAIYIQGSNSDISGSVVLNCSRSASDANILSYRIKAGAGLQPSGSQRQVQLGATANRLNYLLSRGTTAGGSATCRNTSNWEAPTIGTRNVITGTLNFGTSLAATVTWGFCIRVRGTQGMPTAGIYTDTIDVFAQYPNSDAGALTPTSMLNYTLGVNNQCVFNSFPGALTLTYVAFSTTAQTASTTFSLRCSNGLPWSVSVSPANTTLLGLKYDITASPASGIGNGNIGQVINLQGIIQAGQAGTCPVSTCSQAQIHTITIDY